ERGCLNFERIQSCLSLENLHRMQLQWLLNRSRMFLEIRLSFLLGAHWIASRKCAGRWATASRAPATYSGRSTGRTRTVPFSADTSRSCARPTYDVFISAPTNRRPLTMAAIPVEPDPVWGSKTIPFTGHIARTNL